MLYQKNLLDMNPVLVRRKVGMVFQQFNLFPHLSILDNLTLGPIRARGMTPVAARELAEYYLERVRIPEQINKFPGQLSGGQQQRLVIARAIAVGPEVILMDEPCSALDPIATARIEELIDELRQNYCIVIVTHSMSQAARISQHTAFMDRGKLVESGTTEQIFTRPRDGRTHDYITGRYG